MTNSTAPQTINLEPGTQFTSCYQFTNDLWSPCNARELRNPYKGQIRQIQGELSAEFAAPTFSVCREDASTGRLEIPKACKIKLTFSDETYTQIVREHDLDDQAQSNSGTNQPNLGANQSNIGEENGERCDFIGCPIEFIQANTLPILGAFAFVALIFIFKKPLRQLVFGNDSEKRSRSRSSKGNRSSYTNASATTQPPSVLVNNSDYSADQIRRLNERINQLMEMMKQLDTRMLQLEQDSLTAATQRTAARTTTAASIQPPPTNLSPVMPPATIQKPLTVDLIKQALLENNYTLISHVPHLFLSETEESRQGIFERKRFIVQGDQNQSTSLANSEFIAININSSTYLIPNILPNAAEPARTMKRHSDTNDIYRRGAGTNLVKIRELAMVQQLTSDSYELLTEGQIE